MSLDELHERLWLTAIIFIIGVIIGGLITENSIKNNQQKPIENDNDYFIVKCPKGLNGYCEIREYPNFDINSLDVCIDYLLRVCSIDELIIEYRVICG